MVPLERALRAYLWVFCALIAFSSTLTFVAALKGADEPIPRGALLILSALEGLAALGFLLRRLRIVAGGLLALMFILAALLHALHTRDVPVTLLVYLATTLFLLNATRSWNEADPWA